MSVLEKIRNRAGLLVTVIGIALLIFILQAALESGKWFASDRNVGKVGGKDISLDEFDAKVKQLTENYKRQTNQSTIDAATESMVVQQTWNMMVNELIMHKEYEKLGLSVSEDELYDLMLVHPSQQVVQQFTDRETGKINKEFADPLTGKLDVKKLNALVQQMNPEQEQAWSEIEKVVKAARFTQKYNMVVKKGIYVTSLQAKMENVAQNKQFNVRFIGKRYSSIADSSIKVTDADRMAYYNEHQNDFKQDEEARKIEYVSFDVVPTDEDIAFIKSDLGKLTDEFSTKSAKEDSAFVIAVSDDRNFDKTFHKKGTLSPLIDSLFFKEKEGFVYGPYKENNTFKSTKLIGIHMIADSVKANHALFAYKGAERAPASVTISREKAKTKADSIFKLIVSKKLKFEDANQLSDDLASKAKGGEIGWFNSESALAQPFKYGALEHKKGDIFLVESSFGFHIIQVTDNSKNYSKQIQVASIDKKIEASTKTIQNYYSKANSFAGKFTTYESFLKAIEDEKLSKKVADNVKEGDKSIAGLESPKEVVKWMYNEKRKKGDVSEAFEVGNKFIVAALTEIRQKGILPLEFVSDQVEVKTKEKIKGDKIAADFNTKLQGIKDLEAFAQKVALPVEKMDNLTFNTYSLPGAGREDKVIGTVVTMKQGALSKAIAGKNGVYVVIVDGVKEANDLKNYQSLQNQLASNASSRVDYEVSDALRDAANIVDKKAKFY